MKKLITKIFSLAFMLFIYLNMCFCAQYNDNFSKNTSNFFEKFNSFLTANKNGTVTYKWAAKPFNTKKVFKANIVLHYDNSMLNNDSLGNYVFISNDKYEDVFFDNTLYKVDSNTKSLYVKRADSINNPTNEMLLSNNCMPLLKWFIRQKSDPSNLNKSHLRSYISDTTINNNSAWYICFVDTSDELAYDSIQIWTDKSYKLLKFRRDYLDKLAGDAAFTQFSDFVYSKNNILKPESAIEEFIKNGYSVKQENISSGNESADASDTTIKKLDFILTDIEHKEYNLFKLQSKYALFEFANVNCPFCFKSVGMFNTLINTSNVTLFWIDSRDGDDKAYANAIFRKQNIKFPILWDDTREILGQFKVYMFPTLFIIDLKARKILKKIEGYSKENELIINEFLNSK